MLKREDISLSYVEDLVSCTVCFIVLQCVSECCSVLQCEEC